MEYMIDDVTIRVLESILVSKDVQSSIEFKSVLKLFMRDESLLIFGEIAEESVEIKLTCAEFLVRVFAMIGDVESCLALRYEALVLRDEMAAVHPELQVTCKEWLTFAEHSLENGFHSIANQACEKARMCSGAIHLESDDFLHDVHVMEKIDRLKDSALLKISSQSVQAQAKAYSKQKKVKESTQQLVISTETQKGSSLFRSGIKKHNLRKLHEYRCLRMLSG
ncbi:protein DOUBLE-STRAND BREAK FORMATION isoform X2 [Salvia miltiorrhiza]|uniref:protein DOUBLE-STRAND BREAK FORMATION isoform X2 n=1 Tax=Salvia miltiorrhiza TaxID=226208 RepID=UPI0025ABCEFF|nr:protein DOUBLE-STRAND BREAK FORMATION isoform X2 [Salvia miltiorrhiza]